MLNSKEIKIDIGPTVYRIDFGEAAVIGSPGESDVPYHTFSFDVPHTEFQHGVEDEELGRLRLQDNEALLIERMEMPVKGVEDPDIDEFSLELYDIEEDSKIKEIKAGGSWKGDLESEPGTDIAVRFTNRSGQKWVASLIISGKILDEDELTRADFDEYDFSFDWPHTQWAKGLENEEMGRIDLQEDEQLFINRMEMRSKNGPEDTSEVTMDVYDLSEDEVIKEMNADERWTGIEATSTGATVTIRVTNGADHSMVTSAMISGKIAEIEEEDG